MRVEQQAVGEAGRRERLAAVVGVAAVEEHLPPDRAVEQAGVEVRQAVVFGERTRDRALARRGGPIDSDDHRAALRWRSALPMPSRAIAIQMISSTIVGRLKFTVSEMVSSAAPMKLTTLNSSRFIALLMLL